jgi:hypothetical protein
LTTTTDRKSEGKDINVMISKILTILLISTFLFIITTNGNDEDEMFYNANNNNNFFYNDLNTCQANHILDVDYFKCRLCDPNFNLVANLQRKLNCFLLLYIYIWAIYHFVPLSFWSKINIIIKYSELLTQNYTILDQSDIVTFLGLKLLWTKLIYSLYLRFYCVL